MEKSIKLLIRKQDGIVDALDGDGDNQPDDLNGNGSFTDEVKGLEDAPEIPSQEVNIGEWKWITLLPMI